MERRKYWQVNAANRKGVYSNFDLFRMAELNQKIDSRQQAGDTKCVALKAQNNTTKLEVQLHSVGLPKKNQHTEQATAEAEICQQSL